MTDSSQSSEKLAAFSLAWTQSWASAINATDGFAALSHGWEGVICLSPLAQEEATPSLFASIELSSGMCSEPLSSDQAPPSPRLHLVADLGVWESVLEGRSDPILAITLGRIKLHSGSLADVVKYRSAALAMIVAAQTIPTTFSE